MAKKHDFAKYHEMFNTGSEDYLSPDCPTFVKDGDFGKALVDLIIRVGDVETVCDGDFVYVLKDGKPLMIWDFAMGGRGWLFRAKGYEPLADDEPGTDAWLYVREPLPDEALTNAEVVSSGYATLGLCHRDEAPAAIVGPTA